MSINIKLDGLVLSIKGDVDEDSEKILDNKRLLSKLKNKLKKVPLIVIYQENKEQDSTKRRNRKIEEIEQLKKNDNKILKNLIIEDESSFIDKVIESKYKYAEMNDRQRFLLYKDGIKELRSLSTDYSNMLVLDYISDYAYNFETGYIDYYKELNIDLDLI